MKLSVEQAKTFPQTNHIIIPESFRDEMGHMNVQFYLKLFSDSASVFFNLFGMPLEFMEANQRGLFALEHHLNYYAEIHIEDEITLHAVLFGFTAKRIHFMQFFVNHTQNKIAASVEAVAANIDMNIRRMTPFSEETQTQLMTLQKQFEAYNFEAYQTGIMRP